MRLYYSERTKEFEIAYFRDETLLRGKFDALDINEKSAVFAADFMFGLSK
ncbi:hypothetical protein MKZ26_17910 [Sporosarcina sp. FSL K6-6792]